MKGVFLVFFFLGTSHAKDWITEAGLEMQPKVEIEHNDTQDMHKETEKKLMGSWEGSQEDENAGFLILRTFVM